MLRTRTAPGLALTAALSCYLLAGAPAPGAAPAPPATVHVPDLCYSKAGGEDGLRLDLIHPKRGRGPFPAVLVLPGGGWLGGDRKDSLPICEDLARQGYVAAAASYRLVPKHPFPAQLEDARCAVRWMRANAATYRIDPKRVAVLGYSSGGQLACLLGSDGDGPALGGKEEHPGQSSRVQAVVSYSGVTDLAGLYKYYEAGTAPWLERMAGMAALRGLLGGPPVKRRVEAYTRASPVFQARAGAAPTLLIHGSADTLVPLSQSLRYYLRLDELGVPVRLVVLDVAPHAFTEDQERQADRHAVEFLEARLKGARRPGRAAPGTAPGR